MDTQIRLGVVMKRWLVILVVVLAMLGKSVYAESGAMMSASQILTALKEGGYVIYFRHASTNHEETDKHPFVADDCSTQRNLSEKGRAEARMIGEGVRKHTIAIDAVFSSPYCRCKDTAQLAFGAFEVNQDLHFAINASPAEREQLTAQLRMLLGKKPAEGFNNVIVSHTANLREAAKIWPKPEGVAWVFKPLDDGGFKALGKVEPDQWIHDIN